MLKYDKYPEMWSEFDMSSQNPAAILSKKQIKQAEKIHHDNTRKRGILLNNGEPLSAAVKKIFVQLLFVFFVALIVCAGFTAKMFVYQLITDNDIISLTMTDSYASTVKMTGFQDYTSADHNRACLEITASYLGVTPISSQEITSNATMLKALQETFGEENVEMKKNLSNFNYLTDIYDSINRGDMVIVCMTLADTSVEDNTDNPEFLYVPIRAVNYSKAVVRFGVPFGESVKISTDDFIEATRFDTRDLDFSDYVSLVTGKYARNTMFVISGYTAPAAE